MTKRAKKLRAYRGWMVLMSDENVPLDGLVYPTRRMARGNRCDGERIARVEVREITKKARTNG